VNVIRRIEEMAEICSAHRAKGARIGLVPTMGALHEGHIALLRRCRQESTISVMSIFVNPTQFGPKEDLAKYPRPFKDDCEKANEAGCDIVFAPEAYEMYPPEYSTFITIERITEGLCGASRPGHFRGVATVVLKFFNIVSPHVAVFGQKDAQQVAVIKRMVHDLNCNVRIIVEPTVREQDGLAKSSRNKYLTDNERLQAGVLYKGLLEAERLYAAGQRSSEVLRETVAAIYQTAPLVAPEYIEIVHAATLTPLLALEGPALLAVAVRTKESLTRLIDNCILGGEL
jgi:pantoate--beta-alanine ligase